MQHKRSRVHTLHDALRAICGGFGDGSRLGYGQLQDAPINQTTPTVTAMTRSSASAVTDRTTLMIIK